MEQIKRRKKGKKSTYFLLFLIGFSIGIPLGWFLSNQNANLVTLVMVYSSEKRAWIENIAQQFKEYYKARTAHDILPNWINNLAEISSNFNSSVFRMMDFSR